MSNMKIILASGSPRRKEILSMITNNFEVIVSNYDEKFDESLNVTEQVKKLSYNKAKAVFDETQKYGDRIVIGSDTIVVKNNKIYGKPKNHDEAFQMLSDIKNDRHDVITGLAIIIQKDGNIKEFIDYDTTSVYISEMKESEIEEWIASNEAYDKAGGYAIQGKFGVFITRIEGSYYTVMGLPIHLVYKKLSEI